MWSVCVYVNFYSGYNGTVDAKCYIVLADIVNSDVYPFLEVMLSSYSIALENVPFS